MLRHRLAIAWANRARNDPDRIPAHPGLEDDRHKMIDPHGSGIGTSAPPAAHNGKAPAIDPPA
jgi:hypothetical protein